MSLPRPIRLITFEGSEGAGKSTQVRRLEARLRALGHRVLTVREPGGTLLGERLRALLKERTPELSICPEAELLLFLAARAQVVREAIEPALRNQSWVLSDRFSDSTLAYQGSGRGFPAPLLRSLNEIACAGLTPGMTFVLDISSAEGRARIARRAAAGASTDRMETEPPEFFERVRAAYRKLAESEPGRIVLIDASGSEEEIATRIWENVSRVFGL
ncbi:Thymidylate kinase [Methylacidimicrobium sp. AP8]|uniref:dTMP kinase n=1 Tax=Methylacidimicrobium sp. AP8 TaxID=2730359 RepID=UPI0018C0BFED|nr:dTMP kinase [Methylacidimicrobium sp. AP8]CAB4243412.1 Thymidylate kinase [Methylacidimicrobium sp. AP8]